VTPLPYALLDRICDLGAVLDEQQVAALAELLRHAHGGERRDGMARHARMLLRGDALGMFDILIDTWTLLAPRTSGAEIGAALMAAGVQARRRDRPAAP